MAQARVGQTPGDGVYQLGVGQIVKELAKVNEQDVAPGTVLPDMAVQLDFKTLAGKGHTPVLKRGRVVVDEIRAQARDQHLRAKHVLHEAVTHRKRTDQAQVAALGQREDVKRIGLIDAGGHLLNKGANVGQEIKAEALGAVFPAADLFDLMPCLKVTVRV